MSIGVLLAHQGGWDEILLVAGPIVVVGGLLGLANRRAKAELARREAAAGDALSDAPPTPPAP